MTRYRKERMDNLLREEVGQILLHHLDLEEDALITVTRVTVSEDFRQAKVYVSVFPSSLIEKVLQKIQKQIYSLQQILNKQLRMRPIPKIYFVLDRMEEEAAKVESIIEKTKK